MFEQRSEPRVTLSRSVPVRDAHTAEPLGRLINLSRHGFMVLSAAHLAPGRAYRLTAALETPAAGENELTLTGRCIWCQQASGTDSYGAGFSIESRDDDAARVIEALLDDPS